MYNLQLWCHRRETSLSWHRPLMPVQCIEQESHHWKQNITSPLHHNHSTNCSSLKIFITQFLPCPLSPNPSPPPNSFHLSLPFSISPPPLSHPCFTLLSFSPHFLLSSSPPPLLSLQSCHPQWSDVHPGWSGDSRDDPAEEEDRGGHEEEMKRGDEERRLLYLLSLTPRPLQHLSLAIWNSPQPDDDCCRGLRTWLGVTLVTGCTSILLVKCLH